MFDMDHIIGLIGVGSMGQHFANRFINHGYEIVIHDKNEQALAPYRMAEGVSICGSPAEVANRAKVIFVSLPTPEIVREVALGAEGLIHGTKMKAYIDLSTTGHTVAVEISKQLKEKGIDVMDSPVSGGPSGARNGTLAVMVAGDYDSYSAYKPLFEVIGKNIFYIGEKIGQAQVMKVANNLLSATALSITAEAVALGAKAGIDPEVMISVINASSGRNSASMDKFPKSILTRKFDYGFKTGLMYKDVKLCLELAEEMNVPMWLGSSVKQCWGYAISQGGGDRDFTTIVEYVEKMADVSVSKK
jgi:3-hydroxyisobutyrate dehydrogenase-like beta-hydroxyacid dehydrogenase